MPSIKKNHISIGFLSVMMIILLALGTYTFKEVYHSSTFTSPESPCRTNDSGDNYCRYKGLIEGVYVNSTGLQLFYIEDEFTIMEAKEKGFTIENGQAVSLLMNGYGSAGATRMAELLEFAYANSVPVEIHMRNTEQGYLLVDRIWVR
jgi:hypothetical protein